MKDEGHHIMIWTDRYGNKKQKDIFVHPPQSAEEIRRQAEKHIQHRGTLDSVKKYEGARRMGHSQFGRHFYLVFNGVRS